MVPKTAQAMADGNELAQSQACSQLTLSLHDCAEAAE
jgi:hypothetical protein